MIDREVAAPPLENQTAEAAIIGKEGERNDALHLKSLVQKH